MGICSVPAALEASHCTATDNPYFVYSYTRPEFKMPTNEAEWEEMFKMMDEKGQGAIPTDKFATCVRGAGLYPTEANIKEMLEAGGGSKGKVTLDDYMKQMRWLATKHPLDLEQIGESFKM